MKTYYAHYGEDAILDCIFRHSESGFYVDIGCFHPDYFSNTKSLYLKGWRGLNIDANSETISLFAECRPNDFNVHHAVGAETGYADYYKFLDIDASGGGSGNSLSPEVRDAYERQGLQSQTIQVPIATLAALLDRYAPATSIDFMNIDVEGYDMQVLTSNDWIRFRPKVIAVEIWNKRISFDEPTTNPTYSYLRAQNYVAFSCAIHTWFFHDAAYPIAFE